MKVIDIDALEKHLDDAEAKALDSLSRYKFTMFGYWAGVWVHLNQLRVLSTRRPNPFRSIVQAARDERSKKPSFQRP